MRPSTLFAGARAITLASLVVLACLGLVGLVLFYPTTSRYMNQLVRARAHEVEAELRRALRSARTVTLERRGPNADGTDTIVVWQTSIENPEQLVELANELHILSENKVEPGVHVMIGSQEFFRIVVNGRHTFEFDIYGVYGDTIKIEGSQGTFVAGIDARFAAAMTRYLSR